MSDQRFSPVGHLALRHLQAKFYGLGLGTYGLGLGLDGPGLGLGLKSCIDKIFWHHRQTHAR